MKYHALCVILKKRQYLKMSSAANYRWRFEGYDHVGKISAVPTFENGTMRICVMSFLKKHVHNFLVGLRGYIQRFIIHIYKGAQWLGGRVLDSRPKGRGFEPHRRHCVVVFEQDTFILA